MTAATYIVQPGDSLSLISKKFYGDFSQVDALASANNIQNKNLISVGQQLVIPGVEEAEVIETTSGSGKGKWIIGLLVLGVGGWFAWKHYKKSKKSLGETPEEKVYRTFNGKKYSLYKSGTKSVVSEYVKKYGIPKNALAKRIKVGNEHRLYLHFKK